MSLFQKSYNREAFVNFLSDNFLPEDFKAGFQEIELTHKQNFAVKVYRLGECKSLDLEVYEIHHTSVNDARMGIAKDAFQLLVHHSYCNRALVAFVPSSDRMWRFSLIYAEIQLDENKIRRSYNNPRRFSFLLGENAHIKTPTQFLKEKGRVRQRTEGGKTLSPWEDLLQRFSIEVLTQDFYNKLYNWYLWAIDKRTGVQYPKHLSPSHDTYENNQIKIIRLITRMLFVWFIKQKKLIPDNLFDVDFLKTILRDFDPEAMNNGCYYNAILQNLFFATLNQEIDNRMMIRPCRGRTEFYGNKQLYRDTRQSYFTFSEEEREKRIIELFKDIPYLNGGLFECLDRFELSDDETRLKLVTNFDGFSRDSNKKKAFIPNVLFFAQEHIETVTVKEATESKPEETQSISVMGLFELFKQYNFTVEENTTSDKEVSLDPELLGRVFENLLAVYNPETQESARKSTGSFYTPREIVEYMVEESLISYLSDECGNDAEKIRCLIKDGNNLNLVNPNKIIKDLKNVKILDPACGSGAFPMGILLKITDVIESLTPEGQFNRYQTKLEIIKNCIYGIDIQAIAMLICKLRFFISLICDNEKDDTKPNFGIVPLPNLETKFVAANSLLSAKVKAFDDDWTQDEHLRQLQKELLDLRLGIFDLKKHKEKIKNKIADRQKCREIEDYIKKNASKIDEEKIEKNIRLIAKYEAELSQYSGDKWEEVIEKTNNLFEGIQTKVTLKNRNKEKREEIQMRIRICKEEIRKEKNKVALVGFEKAVEEVTHWDPYDQNTVSPFFDEEWMFGIGVELPTENVQNLPKRGFDIVIGNPPYMRIQGIRKTDTLFADYLVKNYKSATGSFDLYVAFVEKSHKLLNSKGVLNFIMPVKWTNSAFGEGLRDYLLNNHFFPAIINFGAYQVFTASTYTGIQLFKHSDSIKYIELDKDIYNNHELNIYLRNIKSHDFETTVPTDTAPWTLANNKTNRILNKIKQNPLTLGDVFEKIFQGLATSKDNVYFLYDCVEKDNGIVEGFSKHLQRVITIERDIVKPLLKGEDVHRYEHIKSNRFVVFPYKFQNESAELYTETELANKFPHGYSYLKECEPELRGREKGRFNVDGVWFQYSRKQGLLFGGIPKLLAPEISLGGNFSYDINGQFYSTTTIYGYMKKKDISLSYETLLAILNSQLCWWFLVHTGTVLANGYYRYKPAYLKPLPIPNITIDMDNLMRNKVNNAMKSSEKQYIDHEINELIYKWYDLTDEEIEEVQKA